MDKRYPKNKEINKRFGNKQKIYVQAPDKETICRNINKQCGEKQTENILMFAHIYAHVHMYIHICRLYVDASIGIPE